MPESINPVLSYWTNLNQNLIRFQSRVRIADQRFYSKFQIRIRFYPVYHWRWFYSRRAKFSGSYNIPYKEWVTNLLPEDRSMLKSYIQRPFGRQGPITKNSIWNKQYRKTYELIQWMYEVIGEQPKLRIEGHHVDLYTNDPEIFSLLQSVGEMVHEIDLVSPKIKPNEIECDNFPLDKYKYRVILKDRCRKDTSLIKVIIELNEQGTIKITDRRLADMKRHKPGGHWPIGDWLYVEDEHNLTLIDLVLGNFISRVIKYVKKENK